MSLLDAIGKKLQQERAEIATKIAANLEYMKSKSGEIPKVYIAGSWANRLTIADVIKAFRWAGFKVFDFTDPQCRAFGAPLSPESVQKPPFNPSIHRYSEYLNDPQFRMAVQTNRAAIDDCDFLVLVLPAGCDSHADWAYGVGKGKYTCVLGYPGAGERTPTHLWATYMAETDNEAVEWARGIWLSYESIGPRFL